MGDESYSGLTFSGDTRSTEASKPSPAVASLLAARSVLPTGSSSATATVLAGALAGSSSRSDAAGAAVSTHSGMETDVATLGDSSVNEVCKAMGEAGITPAVLMMTVARLLPDDSLRKQLQAAAQRTASSPPPLAPPPPSGPPATPPASASARQSPEQHLAECVAAAAKIGKAKADAATTAAEAALRRRAKRAAAEAAFNTAIEAARKQLEHDLEQLAAFIEHEELVDAAHAAADAATSEKFVKELAAANEAVTAADAAAAAAGEARTLRPAATPATPPAAIPFDDRSSGDDDDDDSEELMSVGHDNVDEDGSADAPASVDYVCPPTCTAPLGAEDLAAAASARSVLCHWFAQPMDVPLTFGQLGMPLSTVQVLVGETAWQRDFDLLATPSMEDTVPRPLGGVLLDALGRLHFDASALSTPSGHTIAAIKAAAARAATSKRGSGVIKAHGKRGGTTKTCK